MGEEKEEVEALRYYSKGKQQSRTPTSVGHLLFYEKSISRRIVCGLPNARGIMPPYRKITITHLIHFVLHRHPHCRL
ncbi:hypothetical protein M0802_010351 [Mischocyttarus mexicanus]|nr:hypothetical protein M0802_010351 [Mischocyttarus mexicanus]